LKIKSAIIKISGGLCDTENQITFSNIFKYFEW